MCIKVYNRVQKAGNTETPIQYIRHLLHNVASTGGPGIYGAFSVNGRLHSDGLMNASPCMVNQSTSFFY